MIDEFDGFVSVGGRISFPTEWYVDGDQSKFPASERLDVELALMSGFLERDKPVLGICNGMQMLACLNGCRMVSDVRSLRPDIIQHDERGLLHPAAIKAGTVLSQIVGVAELNVNTHHREAIVHVSDNVVASTWRRTARSKPSRCRPIASPSGCNGTRKPSPPPTTREMGFSRRSWTRRAVEDPTFQKIVKDGLTIMSHTMPSTTRKAGNPQANQMR